MLDSFDPPILSDYSVNKLYLPPELTARLQTQLGPDGLSAFLTCLSEKPKTGLRLNTGKAGPAALESLLPFSLRPIPWAPAGYTFPAQARPGKLPYYQAGLYYLQEPSAMAPAAALDVRPGERVLDLCAAPGGKSTQLAAAMRGEGILIANDNSPKRLKALIWNLEHWGVTNCAVLNEDPGRLAARFSGWFHKILVDAPCSGEGMLRKDPAALHSRQTYNGKVCRAMQDALLDQAALMLAEGGRLAYSTCTFNPLENEEAVCAFLERQPAFRPVSLPLSRYPGWRQGSLLPECLQLWPHLGEGEGQFLALLEKSGPAVISPGASGKTPGAATVSATPSDTPSGRASIPVPGADTAGAPDASSVSPRRQRELAPFFAFMDDSLSAPLPGPFSLFGGHVYQCPAGLPDLTGLKTGRPGWYLGFIKNGRFSPGQPLAMGLAAEQMKWRLDLDPMGELTGRYLRGETLMAEGTPGWTLVCAGGFPLGFGKQTGDYLKNEYPPGWRLT